MNRDLVREASQLRRKALDAFNEERRVREVRPLRAPGSPRKRVGARVDRDRERPRLGPRAVQNIAAVARTQVDQNVGKRAG